MGAKLNEFSNYVNVLFRRKNLIIQIKQKKKNPNLTVSTAKIVFCKGYNGYVRDIKGILEGSEQEVSRS
jgi:hypothetical protein